MPRTTRLPCLVPIGEPAYSGGGQWAQSSEPGVLEVTAMTSGTVEVRLGGQRCVIQTRTLIHALTQTLRGDR
jgi:hypothetical protein